MAFKRLGADETLSSCKKLKENNDLEPDFINFTSVPSLENMAVVSIATAICKNFKVRGLLQVHSFLYNEDSSCESCNIIEETPYYENLTWIEKRIIDKVVSLPLPNMLRLKISNIIRPLQLQLLNWISNTRKDNEYIDSIVWSAEGTIDKIKTLKYLIEKDSLGDHTESYYKLACKYCFEESISSLWNKLSEEIKEEYLENEDIYKVYDNHFLAYWSFNNANNLSRFVEKIRSFDRKNLYNFDDSIYKNMFVLALSRRNILAVKYFWNKLTSTEVSSYLLDWAKLAARKRKFSHNCYQRVREGTDILYFLLSKMNSKTEQREFIQENLSVILNSLFFDWPWQKFLLPTINMFWAYVHKSDYVNLLKNIALNINETRTTEYLFSKLWSDSPVNLKKYFIKKILIRTCNTNTIVLCNLLIVDKVGTVQAILEYANHEDQKQIILAMITNVKFINVVHSDKLHLFDDLCVNMLSQSDTKCLKEKMVCLHGNDICQKWIESGKIDKVDSFLNWAFDTPEERELFKKDTINKEKVTFSLLHKGSYELVNTFLSWCVGSEEEIHKFKIKFALANYEIIEIGDYDFDLFKRYVEWCFISDEEIQNYKSYIKSKVTETAFSILALQNNFDFFENLINWCSNSHDEKKEFLTNFALSYTWTEILQVFVLDDNPYDRDCSNWDLIKKLFKLVSPLDRHVIIEVKENIELFLHFDILKCEVLQKDLFCLLDDDSYELDVDSDSS